MKKYEITTQSPFGDEILEGNSEREVLIDFLNFHCPENSEMGIDEAVSLYQIEVFEVEKPRWAHWKEAGTNK